MLRYTVQANVVIWYFQVGFLFEYKILIVLLMLSKEGGIIRQCSECSKWGKLILCFPNEGRHQDPNSSTTDRNCFWIRHPSSSKRVGNQLNLDLPLPSSRIDQEGFDELEFALPWPHQKSLKLQTGGDREHFLPSHHPLWLPFGTLPLKQGASCLGPLTQRNSLTPPILLCLDELWKLLEYQFEHYLQLAFQLRLLARANYCGRRLSTEFCVLCRQNLLAYQ